jgi:hypothetical protein
MSAPSRRTHHVPLRAHRLAPRAETDLDNIWHYVAADIAERLGGHGGHEWVVKEPVPNVRMF